MEREPIIRQRIIFTGSVQGVGFRFRARCAAEQYGCTGWVRNEYDGSVLMEIKIPGAAPLWLARLLSENGIRMTTFSKYGTYYKDVVLMRDLRNDKGDTKICSIPCSTRSLPAAR